MIYFTENHDSGEVHTKKPYHVGSPQNTDRTFTVRTCACFWEVRCVSRAKGRITGDQFIMLCRTEQEAEAVARTLATPVQARDQGRRVLEELIEEERS